MAFVIDADAGPCQASLARSEITELNAFAAELNSLPMPSQAAAASNMGAEPGPSTSSPELTSGGHTEKFITAPFSISRSRPGRSACPGVPRQPGPKPETHSGVTASNYPAIAAAI